MSTRKRLLRMRESEIRKEIRDIKMLEDIDVCWVGPTVHGESTAAPPETAATSAPPVEPLLPYGPLLPYEPSLLAELSPIDYQKFKLEYIDELLRNVKVSTKKGEELLSNDESKVLISVIAFVEEFERAHQYFLCKQHVKEVCDGHLKAGKILRGLDAEQVAFDIAQKNHEAKKFPLLEMEDVLHLVEVYIWNIGKNCRDSNEYRNPVFYLVFRVLKKGYVLNGNPILELRRLLEFTPIYFDRLLVSWTSPVETEARTVIVSNIKSKVSGKKLWRFFSTCGAIEHVEMKRGVVGQVARITFKDQDSANNASDLNTLGSFAAEKLGQEGGPLLLQFQCNSVEDASDAVSHVKKVDVITRNAEARMKYRYLWMYYKVLQLENVAKIKEESSCGRDDCWDVCEWMQLEAMANGGFTVGGVNVLHDPP